MLAETKSFKMRYRFIYQTLDVYKANTVALKMMMILNFYWYIYKKMQNIAKVETLALTKLE